MSEDVPGYVSITFILTTFLAVGILLNAVKKAAFTSFAGKLLGFLIAFWIFFQAILAQSGLYLDLSIPPKLVLFGVLPALGLILGYFVFFRRGFIDELPLEHLTFVHVVRIPVEFVLLWLFRSQVIPQSMTFEGRNFDILAGLTAPIVWWFAFRNEKPNRGVLLVWNFIALLLLVNIVATAVAAFPAFNPNAAATATNRAVLYFPYVWLPTIVVPIVLFSHLASIYRLFKLRND